MNAHVIAWLYRGTNQLYSYLRYYCTAERYGGPKNFSREKHDAIKAMISKNEQEIEYEIGLCSNQGDAS